MKGRFYHLVYNVARPEQTIPLYKDLFAYFEYRTIDAGDDFLGVSDGSADVWLLPVGSEHAGKPFDRDAAGLNHFAVRLESRELVDEFYVDYMRPRGIPALFDTPRSRPEFRPGGEYYQVLFEDPEGLMVEVLYIE